MDLDLVFSIIEENGYIGLFFWLWFGVFVVPVPNELILMTVGLASSKGALTPFLAFLVTYSGILAAFTTSYMVGRILGRRLVQVLSRKQRFADTIDSSMRMMDKYHAFSLSLSCFVPGVRYLVPLLYGSSRLPFRTFAVFASIGAFIWVSIAFILGYLFGDQMDIVMKYNSEVWFVILAAAIIIIIMIFVRKKKLKAGIGSKEAIFQERQQK